jgi:2-dehydropantoate 2-reductase
MARSGSQGERAERVEVSATIQIVGAGGIGCAIGYALRSVGVSLQMIERSQTKIEAGRRDGLRVDALHPVSAEFIHFDDWQPHPEGIVLLCTKCYDNAAVLERLPTSTQLIPIQNGFDSALERTEHEFEGIVSFVSECPSDRPHTRITRKGKLHIGGRAKWVNAEGHRELVESFRRARLFRVVEVPSIAPFKYTKLMYNAAISPLAAAAGIDNGKLLSVPETRRLFFAFIQENYRILSEAGIELGKVGPFHPATVMAILRRRWVARLFAWAFEPSLRGTYCSMAPDLPRGITEIDFYNQRLIDIAGDRPCPLNRAAVRIIKRMERERIQPNREVLAEFTAALDAKEMPQPEPTPVADTALPLRSE